jgi:hypothetical protein
MSITTTRPSTPVRPIRAVSIPAIPTSADLDRLQQAVA